MDAIILILLSIFTSALIIFHLKINHNILGGIVTFFFLIFSLSAQSSRFTGWKNQKKWLYSSVSHYNELNNCHEARCCSLICSFSWHLLYGSSLLTTWVPKCLEQFHIPNWDNVIQTVAETVNWSLKTKSVKIYCWDHFKGCMVRPTFHSLWFRYFSLFSVFGVGCRWS